MAKKNQFDLIIVGGGILGSFYAFHALQMGLEVALFEKENKAHGSSVRNFGQIVPSGFNSKWQVFGLKSIEIYKQLMGLGDFGIVNNGSLYISSNEEESKLLEELAAINQKNGYSSQLLSKNETLKKYSGINKEYLKSALFFPDEFSVDPIKFSNQFLSYLFSFKKFHYFSNTLIVKTKIEGKWCEAKDMLKNKYYADKIIITSGYEFEILFPKIFRESSLDLVKLQMMRIKGSKSFGLDVNLLTGDTIRRYESFTECPSFKEIKAKENKNSLQQKMGIHMLFKKELNGNIIVGDSHEYAPIQLKSNLDFYIKENINEYFKSQTLRILKLKELHVIDTWIGYYSQNKKDDIFCKTIDNKIHIITGIGGKGMTAGPGFTFYDLKNVL